MATTVAEVKAAGGLNNEDDYLAFRFNTQDELDSAISDAILVAGAWLRSRLPSGVYTSADADTQTALARGEAYLALHFLMPALKSRRVLGTHFAFESEDSDRYAELIDTEWMKLAQDLLETWISFTLETAHFARPRLRVGAVIDANNPIYQPVEEELAETLDRSRSLTVTLP